MLYRLSAVQGKINPSSGGPTTTKPTLSTPTPTTDTTTTIPTKLISTTMRVQITCNISEIPVSGRADLKVAKFIVSKITPSKLIILRSTISDSDSLAYHARSLAIPTYIPVNGDTLSLSIPVDRIRLQIPINLIPKDIHMVSGMTSSLRQVVCSLGAIQGAVVEVVSRNQTGLRTLRLQPKAIIAAPVVPVAPLLPASSNISQEAVHVDATPAETPAKVESAGGLASEVAVTGADEKDELDLQTMDVDASATAVNNEVTAETTSPVGEEPLIEDEYGTMEVLTDSKLKPALPLETNIPAPTLETDLTTPNPTIATPTAEQPDIAAIDDFFSSMFGDTTDTGTAPTTTEPTTTLTTTTIAPRAQAVVEQEQGPVAVPVEAPVGDERYSYHYIDSDNDDDEEEGEGIADNTDINTTKTNHKLILTQQYTAISVGEITLNSLKIHLETLNYNIEFKLTPKGAVLICDNQVIIRKNDDVSIEPSRTISGGDVITNDFVLEGPPVKVYWEIKKILYDKFAFIRLL